MSSTNNTSFTNTTMEIKILKDHPEYDRYFEYQTLRCKYPDFVPIAFENLIYSPKNKLASKIINFRFYTAKAMKLDALRQFAKSLITTLDDNPNKLDLLKLFVNDNPILDYTVTVNDVYKTFKEKDGWLYLKFILEA